MRDVPKEKLTDREILESVVKILDNLLHGVTNSERSTRSQLAAIRADQNEGQGVLIGILTAVEELRSKGDVSKITAADLADRVPKHVINSARNIQYAVERGEPIPLHPAPFDIVPSNGHRKDESISFVTDKDGNTVVHSHIKAKTVLGWFAATVMAAWHLYTSLKGH